MLLRIGTRGSALARAQASEVAALLRARWPHVELRTVFIEASGDADLATPFAALAPDAFTDRIEQALRDGEIDVAVHSWKDLPPVAASDLRVAAVPVRADAREALVSRDGATLDRLPPGAAIGTSSERRMATLRQLRPDCRLLPIRGPVDDRLAQVARGDFDAAIFAVAGLVRLGLGHRITEYLDPVRFPPAAGQGALAVQCRAADDRTRRLVAAIDDAGLHAAVLAECA
jgi:hydroxymethylbilane synthase